MSENMQDNETPHYDELDIQHIKNVDEQNELTVKYVAELNNNAAFQEYLLNFRGDCVESLTKEFASFKADYTINAKWRFERKHQIDNHFVKEAEEIIWYIQQKKLFDLQCRWRAEQVEIPEITITHQFDYWSRNIKNCHFIEPITEADVELLQQYLASYSFDENVFTLNHWQDYDTFKKEHLGDPDGLSMPEWYQFYNMHRGTESLLLLPDYKKEIEHKFIVKGADLQDEIDKQNDIAESITEMEEPAEEEYDADDPPPYKPLKLTAPTDTRPFLLSDYNEMGKFIDLFEDSRLKEIHSIRRGFDDYSKVGKWDRVAFNDALEILRYAGNNYPMEPYHCWRKGTIRLAMKFKNEQIIKALPQVFEAYKTRENMGIAHFVSRHDQSLIDSKKKFVDMFLKWYNLGKAAASNNE